MPHTRLFRPVAAAVACALSYASGAFAAPVPPLSLTALSTFDAGGAGSAEIVGYHAATKRVFVVNALTATVDILDISNAQQPVRLSTISTAGLGNPNSVAVHGDLIAVAIEASPKTNPGHVAFYTPSGELIVSVQVGALPDMLTFTPDGRYVLVANEGEPSGYGAGQVDPEGSVSIIPVPNNANKVKDLVDSDVLTAGFSHLNIHKEYWLKHGIRIYGPGATLAQDFEPEYITVTADSRRAYVTLQENNALVEIDIAGARVTKLLPIGYKNYAEQPQIASSYTWVNRPVVGFTPAGQRVRLGGFSGLAFEGVTGDGRLRFITHTDRGPNGEPIGINRPFVLPDYNPRIVRFTLDPSDGAFQLTEQIPLRRPDGSLLTGLPNTALSTNANQAYNDEVPIDLFGHTLPLDPLGGDFEGIAVAADGSFWMADEYRPALYHFASNGTLIERAIPIGTHAAAGLPVPAPGVAGSLGTESLPAVIAQRRQNRGFEAVVLQNGKVYGFVQSPLRNPETLGNAALNSMKNVRVVELDPVTRATRQFLYVMDNPPSVGAADTIADKIGDATGLPGGGFLVVERDDDAVPEDPLSTITKKVYSFNLTGATEISALGAIDVGGGVLKTVDQMSVTELAAAGVVPVAKTLHVDLAAAGYADVEKVEGLTLLNNGQIALINDNDFGTAQIVINNATGGFTLAPGYQPEEPVLGIISVPGLDASDRDNRINISSWPVFGMYEPDAIVSLKDGNKQYLITANEGDARDWPGLTEESRVSALTLDPTVFPNAAALRNNAALGRLNVTNTRGDTDGDGDFDELYTLGGRSFSVWDIEGGLVYDSGSDFERIIAARNPAFFNASNDDRAFDSRSDNKGPEPEGLTLGKIGDRTYAFIGLERQGGVMVYDVTHPYAPVFVDYANNRNFAVDPATSPAAGDLGPEGLIFISADKSPTQRPLLIVANEVSGTVTLYDINGGKAE